VSPSRSDHDVNVRATLKDHLTNEMRALGREGAKSGGSIAAGFIKAQAAIFAARAAVKAIGRTIKAITVDAVQEIDRIGKTAQKIGVSVEFLSEMGLAAELSGAKFDVMARGLRNVSRNARMVANDSREMIAVYDQLGFSQAEFLELAAKGPETLFLAIAEALSRVEDEGERVALAMRAVGEEAGPQLLPMFANGVAGIREMRKEAERLGMSISKADFELAARTNDAITRFEASLTGIKRALALELMPAIAETLDTVSGILAKYRGNIVQALKGVLFWVANALVSALEAVSVWIAKLVDAIENRSVVKSLGKDLFKAQIGILSWGLEQTGVIEEQTGMIMRAAAEAATKEAPGGGEKAARAFWEGFRARLEQGAAEWKAAEARGELNQVLEGIASVWNDQVRSSLDLFVDPIKEAARSWFGRGPELELGAASLGPMPEPASILGSMDPNALDSILDSLSSKVELLGATSEKERELIALEQELDTIRKAALETEGRTSEQMRELIDLLAEYEAARRGQIETDRTFWAGARDAVDGLKQDAHDLGGAAVTQAIGLWDRFWASIQNGAMNTGEKLRAFVVDALKNLSRLAMNRLFVQLLDTVIPSGGGEPAAKPKPQASLSEGGLVTRPTIAMLHGPELVIPLHKLSKLGGLGGGGGRTINQITISAPAGSNLDQLAELVGHVLERQTQRSAQFRGVLAGEGGL